MRFQSNSNNRRVWINHFLILAVISVFIFTGCNQENFNAIHSKEVIKIKSGLAGKTQAVASLQSVIDNAKDISVRHIGFKPSATPPNPPPNWTPQQVLKIDESAIRTSYIQQHWLEESTVTKVGGGGDGNIGLAYSREMTYWQGIKGEATFHSVEIPFSNIEQIGVVSPFFYEYTIVKLYYTKHPGPVLSDSNSDVFKIWIPKNQKKQFGATSCLAALSVLCQSLKN